MLNPIKTFKDIIRKKLVKRYISHYLSTPKKGSDFVFKDLNRIICIFDMDKYDKYKELYNIAKITGISSHKFKLIGCSSSSSKRMKKGEDGSSVDSFPVFYQDEYGWNGVITNKEVKRIISTKYDILINYFSEEKPHLLVLSSKITTKLRVGFSGINVGYNDLIIDTGIENTNVFIQEFMRFAKILNKSTKK